MSDASGVKSLKALPNADSTLSEIKANTGEKFIPVAIVDAVVYWMKMAVQGNLKAQAILMACAVESIERRADAAFGVSRSEPEINQRMRSLIDCILNEPKIWTMHFKPQWREEACRVTGYRWHPSKAMAQFISTYIYKALPSDVYIRLMELNAERRVRHHQFFDEVADELILKEHIQQVGGLLRVSRSKAHFKQLFADAFSNGIQAEIALDREDVA